MGVELLFNSVEFGSQSSCQQNSRQPETRCGREDHSRPKGALGKAPMEWTPRPLVEHLREQERHNVTVITVGSKYEVYVQSPASSHMQTLEQPFQTLAIKKSSCFLYSCVFLPASFILASVIIASVCIPYIYVYFCMNQQMTMQHFNVYAATAEFFISRGQMNIFNKAKM